MKKKYILGIMFFYSTFIYALGVPVTDVSVQAKDTANAAAVMAAYSGFASTLASSAINIQNSVGFVNQMGGTSQLVKQLCAGCSPATMSNLKNTLDNLNIGMCKSFANMLGLSGDVVSNMSQLSNVLSSGTCTATAGVSSLSGAQATAQAMNACSSALQIAATRTAAQSAAIQQNTQAMMAAQAQKADAKEELDGAAQSAMWTNQ